MILGFNTIRDLITKPKPPETVWELIDLALNDIRAAEDHPEYTVNMTRWHEPTSFSGQCQVCAAGSVMMNTLKADVRRHYTPANYGIPWHNRLMALNMLRSGQLNAAAEYWSPCKAIKDDRCIRWYEHDRDGFFADMTKLRDDYKAIETA